MNDGEYLKQEAPAIDNAAFVYRAGIQRAFLAGLAEGRKAVDAAFAARLLQLVTDSTYFFQLKAYVGGNFSVRVGRSEHELQVFNGDIRTVVAFALDRIEVLRAEDLDASSERSRET